jgi:hypothetical protein
VTDDAVSHHATDSHMDAHTTLSDDDHGHAEPRLGPIDWPAWAYAAGGFAIGLVVAGLFWLKMA